MGTIAVRCYAELNDFLPLPRRQRAFSHTFTVAGSVKDALESFGVPHPEIDLILVNGEPAGFDRVLSPGDRVAAYPRFLLDGHLGRLARYLRLLGLDAAHQAQADDARLAAAAAAEDRTLLTRDLDLLKRSVVRRGYRVRSTDPEEQAVEVVRHFGLADGLQPFSRCLPCGERLVEAAAADAAGVPPGVAARHTEYHRCPGCGRLYWRGSHFPRLVALATRVRAGAVSP